jgi:hypothetical protein
MSTRAGVAALIDCQEYGNLFLGRAERDSNVGFWKLGNELTELFEWIYIFSKWPYTRLLVQVVSLPSMSTLDYVTTNILIASTYEHFPLGNYRLHQLR